MSSLVSWRKPDSISQLARACLLCSSTWERRPPPPLRNIPPLHTPIQHVIVIIGENRTFDHVYGTFIPKHGQTVSNLLSRGIVTPTARPASTTGSPPSTAPSIAALFEISPGQQVRLQQHPGT